MTIETQINRVQFEGHGRDFPVPFPVQRPEHLRLFLWQNNRQTRLTDGFTVIGAGTQAVTVSLDAPLPAGARLTILREVPLVQPMNLQRGGSFDPKVLEGSADNLVMQIQQLAEGIARAIIFPEGFPGERPDYNILLDLKSDAEAARDEARSEAGRAGTEAGRAEEAAGNAAAEVRDELAGLATAAEKAQAGARLAKSQARAAATLARKWAASPEGVPVLPGLFSARHYAMKAAEATQGAAEAAQGSGFSLFDIKPNIKGVIDPDFLSICVDNGVLARSAYPEAYDELTRLASQTGSNIVTMAQYASQMTANGGVCGRFARDATAQTFRIPCMPGAFWRGGSGSLTVGTWQRDQMQGHWHNAVFLAGFSMAGSAIPAWPAAYRDKNSSREQEAGYWGAGSPTSDGTNGEPRTGSETRPMNIAVDWQMKMKY